MGLWLENIELTEEEYYNLQGNWFDYGSESRVVREGDFVIKVFRDNFGHDLYDEDEIEMVRENKFQKIVKLASMKDFDNELILFATYSYHKKFVAYKMNYLSYPTLESLCLGEKELLFYLKLIKNKLLEIHELGIVYGDVKDDNIFVDLEQQRIVFGDIDNMQIGELSIDMMSTYAKNFVKSYGRVDEKLDSYMMNLMTLYQLRYYSGWYDEIIENLEWGFIPNKKLTLPKNKKLVREMGHISRNYSGDYFVNHL